MGTISRWMPPSPEHPGTAKAVAVLAALSVGTLAAVVAIPELGLGIAGVALGVTLLSAAHNRRLRRIAAERPSDDIGTFARRFDRRTVDPWVIRAVWDAFQPYLAFPGGRLPLRASDRLDDDLRIDPDDIDMLVDEVSARVGRTLKGIKDNPFLGRVRTVGDVVSLINHQPKRPDA